MDKIINCNKFLSFLVEIFNQVFATWVSIFVYMLKQHFKLLSMVFAAINFVQLHRLPLMMAYYFILNSRSAFKFSSFFLFFFAILLRIDVIVLLNIFLNFFLSAWCNRISSNITWYAIVNIFIKAVIIIIDNVAISGL